MAYDFLKNFMALEDEEKFNRLCQALEDMIIQYGGKPIMWKTGHSLIKDKMKEINGFLKNENLTLKDFKLILVHPRPHSFLLPTVLPMTYNSWSPRVPQYPSVSHPIYTHQLEPQ